MGLHSSHVLFKRLSRDLSFLRQIITKKNFILNGITALVGDKKEGGIPSENIPNTISAIDKFVMCRKVITGVFELNVVMC